MPVENVHLIIILLNVGQFWIRGRRSWSSWRSTNKSAHQSENKYNTIHQQSPYFPCGPTGSMRRGRFVKGCHWPWILGLFVWKGLRIRMMSNPDWLDILVISSAICWDVLLVTVSSWTLPFTAERKQKQWVQCTVTFIWYSLVVRNISKDHIQYSATILGILLDWGEM